MIKPKWFVYCWMAWLAACTSAARAEVTYTEIAGHMPADDPLTVIRMTVTPAPEPAPPLRHRLTLRSLDEKSGNAALWYYRALSDEGLDFQAKVRRNREEFGDEQYDSWFDPVEVPLRELPIENAKKAFSLYRNELNYLREASTRRQCDWQRGIEDIRGPELIQVLLPEIHQLRSVSRALALGARLAVAEQRYGDALELLRINHRMAQHTATEPFLVSGLVGIAITSIGNSVLTELIAAPDSPNLYWALTELPQPLVDMRPAARFELDFGPRMFPLIHQAETTERSPQEWNRLFTETFRDLRQMVDGASAFDRESAGSDAVAGLAATGVALLGYTHAKQQLIEQGMDRERVEKMAVGQVMAIYSERTYRRFADDFEKLWYVPFWKMRKYSQAIEERLRAADVFGGGGEREVLPIAQWLTPAMQAARTAQVRLERDVAALRAIEALRMHAAAHDGRLPERLDDIDLVPVPLNPATGQPFAYRLEGATAVLDLPSTDGFPGYNRRFEIQIADRDG